jgi:mRNA-degrading endonuclease RelE of RelBE toxin-antitoxin system
MAWTVRISKKASKQVGKAPEKYRVVLVKLMRDLELFGPVRGEWPNYSKLGPGFHHCHLKKKGKPTYVACWQVLEKEIKLMEVYYVGTREKAPY